MEVEMGHDPVDCIPLTLNITGIAVKGLVDQI